MWKTDTRGPRYKIPMPICMGLPSLITQSEKEQTGAGTKYGGSSSKEGIFSSKVIGLLGSSCSFLFRIPTPAGDCRRGMWLTCEGLGQSGVGDRGCWLKCGLSHPRQCEMPKS